MSTSSHHLWVLDFPRAYWLLGDQVEENTQDPSLQFTHCQQFGETESPPGTSAPLDLERRQKCPPGEVTAATT